MFVLLTFSNFWLNAQLTGNNTLQLQYGQLPGDTESQLTFYDRTVVNYGYKKLKAGLTLEQFYSPFKSRNYTKLTQLSLSYNSKYIDFSLGNYYETLGRGLLLRSYQIPGAILEDLSYRSQHYFHRDLVGFNTKIKLKNFSTTVLYGKPLNNVFAPTQSLELRRSDEIMAVQSEYTAFGQTIGASVMNLNNSTGNSLYAMANLSGNLFPFLSYYFETAKKTNNSSISDFSNNASFALYGGLNFSFDNLGISAEYKNYNNFVLGSGINEPPALVKEHTYRMLNRSTHVLQPTNEKGYQIEAFYTFADASTMVLNNTMAVNNFGSKKVFQEIFAEYSFEMNEKHDLKVFADLAQDPFKLEANRISTGFYGDWKISKKSSIKTDYEFQTFTRSSSAVQNHVLALTYSYKSKFAINFTGELSNDPFLIETKPTRLWLGTNLKYQLNNANTLSLFAGQRRGGPACNAGVCYEVLDFTGVELRFATRF